MMFNIREVLHQIEKDVESGNMDAVAELLSGLLNDGEEAISDYLEERKV